MNFRKRALQLPPSHPTSGQKHCRLTTDHSSAVFIYTGSFYSPVFGCNGTARVFEPCFYTPGRRAAVFASRNVLLAFICTEPETRALENLILTARAKKASTFLRLFSVMIEWGRMCFGNVCYRPAFIRFSQLLVHSARP